MQTKVMSSRVDNATGKRIYSMDCVVDSQRRSIIPDPTVESAAPTVASADKESEDDLENVVADNVAADTSVNEGKVIDRWRLISAVEAWPTSSFWLPQLVDYSHEDGKALKTIPKLVKASKPDLMWNHSDDSRNIAGHVDNAAWEASTDIPPGVNGDLVVDPAYDPKAALGLQNGTIRNGSIGISMDLEPSHPDMEWEDFVQKQGKKVNGEKVRWLPIKVTAVRHMAMIPQGLGADPNAGKRQENNSVNPDHMLKKENDSMDDFRKLLEAVCGKLGIDVVLTEDGPVPEGLDERIDKKLVKQSDLQAQLNELKAELQDIGADLLAEGETELTASEVLKRIPAALETAKLGKAHLEFRRAEALRWFDAAKVRPEDAQLTEHEKRMRARIEESTNLDFIEDISAEYQSVAQERFGTDMRTSGEEELPPIVSEKKNPTETDLNIRESVGRMFQGGSK